MSLWSRLVGRKTLEQLPPFARWPESKAGIEINTTTALGAATIMACTRAIAEGVAQTEIKFHRQSGGKERILDHPLLPILTRRPNPWQTSFEFRETLLFHLVLCGNAFVFVNRVRGQVVELIPIEPGKVWVQRNPDMTMTYTVTFEDGRAATLTAADIWHHAPP